MRSHSRTNPFDTWVTQVPLASYPSPTVNLTCSLCSRRGRYRLETLKARFGSDAGLVNVLNALSADCERAKPDTWGLAACRAHYVELRAAPSWVDVWADGSR